MKTRTIIGATGAYFCITDAHHTLDVLLPAGKGVHAALRQVIAEHKADIARRQARLELIERAADRYDADHGFTGKSE